MLQVKRKKGFRRLNRFASRVDDADPSRFRTGRKWGVDLEATQGMHALAHTRTHIVCSTPWGKTHHRIMASGWEMNLKNQT